jgi:uncharacterized protein (DUF433 family)
VSFTISEEARMNSMVQRKKTIEKAYGEAKAPSKKKRSQQAVEVGKHLIVHPGVCFGKMTFKGTRVPVETILYFLSTGRPVEEILKGWPELTKEGIAEAVQLAGAALVEKYQVRPRHDHEPVRAGRSA